MSEYKFDVVGIFAHRDEMLSLVRKNKDYWDLSDAALMTQHKDGDRIYAYGSRHLDCELVPEPTNSHDPNAIMVLLEGQHVGYVPAVECAAVHPLLGTAVKIKAHIFGGPSKVVSADSIRHYDDDLSVRVTITYEGASVQHSRSNSARTDSASGSTSRAPVIAQWVVAWLLLGGGLSMLPSFASVLFILAAVLCAPVRQLRDLLARYRIRPWMIAAAAVVLTVLGFIILSSR